MTRVSGDMTLGEMTLSRLDCKPARHLVRSFGYFELNKSPLLETHDSVATEVTDGIVYFSFVNMFYLPVSKLMKFRSTSESGNFCHFAVRQDGIKR